MTFIMILGILWLLWGAWFFFLHTFPSSELPPKIKEVSPPSPTEIKGDEPPPLPTKKQKLSPKQESRFNSKDFLANEIHADVEEELENDEHLLPLPIDIPDRTKEEQAQEPPTLTVDEKDSISLTDLSAGLPAIRKRVVQKEQLNETEIRDYALQKEAIEDTLFYKGIFELYGEFLELDEVFNAPPERKRKPLDGKYQENYNKYFNK